MERVKKILFKEKEYQVTFPTVGQFIDMETEKIKYSGGQWANLITSGTLSGLRAIQVIECLSFFTTVCPAFLKDLAVENILDIDAIDFAELVKLYKKDISPWYAEWFKAFNSALKEEEEGK